MRKQRNESNLPPDDDGRTVAPMDAEGMPWHVPARPRAPRDPDAEPLRGAALFRYMLSAVGAGLLVVLAFSVAGAAFILFCTQIWFR